MIGKICGKVAVIGENCKVTQNSQWLVEFAWNVLVASSQRSWKGCVRSSVFNCSSCMLQTFSWTESLPQMFQTCITQPGLNENQTRDASVLIHIRLLHWRPCILASCVISKVEYTVQDSYFVNGLTHTTIHFMYGDVRGDTVLHLLRLPKFVWFVGEDVLLFYLTDPNHCAVKIGVPINDHMGVPNYLNWYLHKVSAPL